MKKDEYRKYRPYLFYFKKQDKAELLNTLEIYDIGKTKIEFTTPNIITMFINICHREYLNSFKIYNKLILPILKKEKNYKFEGENLTELYDYIESVNISIIFAYNAVEAFVNISIPDNYIFNKKNNKGINESWDKKTIQRWMSTSEKMINILPQLRNVEKPNMKLFWPDFKKLEELRNDIIHPKQLSKEVNTINEIHKEFFNSRIFKIIKSIKSVLNHFCQGEFSEHYFPIGFGSSKIKAIEIDDFDEYF
jgi:hypothetical protein